MQKTVRRVHPPSLPIGPKLAATRSFLLDRKVVLRSQAAIYECPAELCDGGGDGNSPKQEFEVRWTRDTGIGNEDNGLQSSGPESRGQPRYGVWRALACEALGGGRRDGQWDGPLHIFPCPAFSLLFHRPSFNRQPRQFPGGSCKGREMPGEERRLVGLAGGHGLDPSHPASLILPVARLMDYSTCTLA